MRAKLLCKHSPTACWVSNFSREHPGIRLYAYPISRGFKFPTIYFVAVVIVIPKDKLPADPKKFETRFREFAEGWPPRLRLDRISEPRQRNGELHLYYFVKAEAIELISIDREKVKAYSLLYAVFNQDSPPRSLRWILAQDGLESTFPVFDDTSSWKRNVEHLKTITLDSEHVCDVMFPQDDADYSFDYSAEFAAQPDPLAQIFADSKGEFPFPVSEFDQADQDRIRELIRQQPRSGLWARLRSSLKKEHVRIALELLKEFLKSSRS